MPIRFTFQNYKTETPRIVRNHPEKNITRLADLQMFKTPEEATGKNQQKINSHKRVEEILKELDSLVGLHEVKKLIIEIRAFVEIQKKREREELIAEPLVLHMIFKGNPGTGKTTVARIVGKLFKEMGVLEKGHVIEVERADLVGEYIGHTAHKTREQIKRSLGGVLFIDEAYSLARGGEKDFGKEAIDTMVKNMEEHKDNLVLILAGYKQEMNWFIETNPGLRSRFPIHIDFPDYSVGELLEIANQMLKKRQYQLTEAARAELEAVLAAGLKNNHEHSGNARFVRNLIEKAIRRQALRLIGDQQKLTKTELVMINEADILSAADTVL